MSVVTNLILSFSVSEDERSREKEINSFYNNGRNFKIISADFERNEAEDYYEVKTWYAGSKYLETPLYVGAYNHLDIDGLIEHLKKVHWEEPKSVQLIIKRQESDIFEIIHIVDT